MNVTIAANIEAAFEYISKGFPVIPLCWPNHDGSCACGRGHEGKSIGKVPLTELTQLLSVKSMSLNLPPNGIATLERWSMLGRQPT